MNSNIKTELTEDEARILTDVQYICKSTSLITDSLRNGNDVAQLPNGDIMVTEVKVVHMYYTWDKEKSKMVRIS